MFEGSDIDAPIPRMRTVSVFDTENSTPPVKPPLPSMIHGRTENTGSKKNHTSFPRRATPKSIKTTVLTLINGKFYFTMCKSKNTDISTYITYLKDIETNIKPRRAKRDRQAELLFSHHPGRVRCANPRL